MSGHKKVKDTNTTSSKLPICDRDLSLSLFLKSVKKGTISQDNLFFLRKKEKDILGHFNVYFMPRLKRAKRNVCGTPAKHFWFFLAKIDSFGSHLNVLAGQCINRIFFSPVRTQVLLPAGSLHFFVSNKKEMKHARIHEKPMQRNLGRETI